MFTKVWDTVENHFPMLVPDCLGIYIHRRRNGGEQSPPQY